MTKLFGISLLVCGTAIASAVEGQLGIHDPSTIAVCAGKYYVFGTGRGVSVLTSSNGSDWQRGGRVFDRVPESSTNTAQRTTVSASGHLTSSSSMANTTSTIPSPVGGNTSPPSAC